jgi:hypothetical protein
MPLDLLQEIVNNKFLLLLLDEDECPPKLEEIIKFVEKTKTRICYICLSKPYSDIMEELGGKGFNTDNFFFIDVLSSHYREHGPAGNCIFVSSPSDLKGLRDTIRKATKERKCSVILFDAISTLLVYQETSSIVKFTHHLLIEKEQENVKKLFIVLKGDSVPKEENQKLVNDLMMFADKALDVG